MKTNEMKAINSFNAPIEALWKAWTLPEHIKHWWGPDGFTSTIHQMDVWEGGEWKATLHSPDGTNYPNRNTFQEIVPFRKIVYEHFNPHFITTITFESVNSQQTQVEWSTLFDTAEMREIIVKVHKGDEIQRLNLEKLKEYLLQMTGE